MNEEENVLRRKHFPAGGKMAAVKRKSSRDSGEGTRERKLSDSGQKSISGNKREGKKKTTVKIRHNFRE